MWLHVLTFTLASSFAGSFEASQQSPESAPTDEQLRERIRAVEGSLDKLLIRAAGELPDVVAARKALIQEGRVVKDGGNMDPKQPRPGRILASAEDHSGQMATTFLAKKRYYEAVKNTAGKKDLPGLVRELDTVLDPKNVGQVERLKPTAAERTALVRYELGRMLELLERDRERLEAVSKALGGRTMPLDRVRMLYLEGVPDPLNVLEWEAECLRMSLIREAVAAAKAEKDPRKAYGELTDRLNRLFKEDVASLVGPKPEGPSGPDR